jgi:hypothetical protein
MGFNPFRPGRVARTDLIMIAASTGIALALIAWAIWG